MKRSATTILFTDIEGSSALIEGLGDRRWMDLLRAHNAIVREQVESFRGFEVKTVGDGFMVAFPGPRPALACAVAIQRALAQRPTTPPLRVRMGLHAGETLEEDGDFFGREVVVAARVSAQARGGEILVSDAVRAAADGVDFAAPRVVRLKGLAGVHPLHPVAWEGEPDPLPPEARLVLEEREPAREQLGAALESASAGRGAVLAVTAAAGLGKSALLEALSGQAEQAGFVVLAAEGSEIERAFTYGVARQLLEPLGHGRADEPEDDIPLGAAAFRTYARLTQLVTEHAEHAPLALLVDDAHWADDGSLAWLGFLARRLRGLPVLLAVGARDDEPNQPEHLPALLAAATVHVRPAPLSLAAVKRIIEVDEPGATPQFAAAVHRASGGVPLYVRELLASARSAGVSPDREGAARLPGITPESVRRLVLGRLEPLGEDAVALARACATLDVRADIRTAGRLARLGAGEAIAAADLLCERGIFRARRPLGFAHPIMQSVVRGETPPGQRSRMHRMAAGMLAEDGAPPQEVAAHLLATEPMEDAGVIARLREAAAAALADGAPANALAFLERALEEPPSRDELGAVLAEAAYAATQAGRSPRAMELARRALPRLDDPGERARVVALLARAARAELSRPGTTLEWEADGPPLLSLVDDAVRQLDDADRALRFELEALSMSLALARLTILSSPMPAEDAARLERLAEEATGDSPGEREILAARTAWASAMGTAPMDEVLRIARRALDDGTLVRELAAGSVYDSAIETLILCGAHAEAERHLADAARLARRYGVAGAAALIAAYRASNAWASGALADALDFAAEAAAHLDESGPDAYVHAVAAGSACAALMARDQLDAAESTARGIEHPRLRDHALGLVAAARGDHAAAVEHLRPAQATLDRRGLWRSGGPLRPVRPDLAVSLAAVGEHEEAREVLARELRVARAFGQPSCIAEALRAQAHVEGSREPLEEAAELIKGSEARLVEARILTELGDPRGRAIADRCGASVGPATRLAS